MKSIITQVTVVVMWAVLLASGLLGLFFLSGRDDSLEGAAESILAVLIFIYCAFTFLVFLFLTSIFKP